jgi:hypothetical protein
MLQDISEYIHGWARGRLVLTLIAVFVLFINLPLGDPALISTSLDGRIGYTPEQAYSAISSYGNIGRTQMIWIHLGYFILIPSGLIPRPLGRSVYKGFSRHFS